MFDLDPWMVRTGAVIAFLFLVDVALYVLNLRVERRRSKWLRHLVAQPSESRSPKSRVIRIEDGGKIVTSNA